MNELTHIWSVICGSSIIDSQTNNITLSNVLEQLTIQLPKPDRSENVDPKKTIQIVNLNYDFITLWAKDDPKLPANGIQKIDIIDPLGIKVGTFEGEMSVPAENQRMRMKIQFNNIGITVSGNYKFVVYMKNEGSKNFKEMASIPLEVKKM